MRKYYWTGISRDDRINAISEINGIASQHSIILNFQRISDISLSLVLEVEINRLNSLHSGLSKIMTLKGIVGDLEEDNSESLVLLNVTFIKATGDLLIENPNIPE